MFEVTINKEYKSAKSFVIKIEEELQKAGIPDELECFVDNHETVKDKILRGEDWSVNMGGFGKDKWTIAIDIRPFDFIYIFYSES